MILFFPTGKPMHTRLGLVSTETLLWYEPLSSSLQGRSALPHIIDANRLKRCLADGQPNAWQQRAIAVEDYIALQWGVGAIQVRGIVNRLMTLPQYQDAQGLEKQRHNTLGIAFAALIVLVLLQLRQSESSTDLRIRKARSRRISRSSNSDSE